MGGSSGGGGDPSLAAGSSSQLNQLNSSMTSLPASPMHAKSQNHHQQHHEKRIRLKCHWQNGIRVVNATRASSFQTLKQRLEADYGFEISLQYEDPEGDMITLASQNDLVELIDQLLDLLISSLATL